MKYALFTLCAVSLISACAQSPDAISPVSMAGAYDHAGCTQARSLLSAERTNLDALSAAQKNAVAGDAIGVFLIGVPVSSLSGSDKAGAIATSKGKILALEARLSGC